MIYHDGDQYFLDTNDEGKTIVCCISGKSGRLYAITEEGCDCKGFQMRGKCRHYEGAKLIGLHSQMIIANAKQEIKSKEKDFDGEKLFVVCYAEHENRLIVNHDQLITVMDNAKKHDSKMKVFELGKNIIDWT